MKAIVLATVTLSAILISGCGEVIRHPYINNQPEMPDHSVQVRPVAYQFVINLAGRQLDQQDSQAFRDFVESHGKAINQRLIITQVGAVYERRQLERWVRQLGMPSAHVRWQAEAGSPERQVRITTEYFVARTPDCPGGDQTRGLPLHQQHRYPGFGCATASNLAMMVSDPRELVKGQALAPASGVRGVNAIRSYQQFVVTPPSSSGRLSGSSGSGNGSGGSGGSGGQ